MIRDNLILYNYYYNLDLRCFSCNYFNHISLKCPMVHIVMNREFILRMHQRSFPQNRDSKFLRQKKTKKNSLFHRQTNVEAIKKLNSYYYFPGQTILCQSSVDHPIIQSSLISNTLKSSTDEIFESFQELDSVHYSFEDLGNAFPEKTIGRSSEDAFSSSQRRKTVHKFHEIEEEEVCSIERESMEKEWGSETSGHNTGTTKIGRIDIDEKLLMFLNEDFHFLFDKMKNYEVYFVHNNAESIVEKIKKKQERSFNSEARLMEFAKRREEKENSSQNIPKLNFFFSSKNVLLPSETKIKTCEVVGSPIMNKKLRQENNMKLFQGIIKPEKGKISEISKKINKKRNWICFKCGKQNINLT